MCRTVQPVPLITLAKKRRYTATSLKKGVLNNGRAPVNEIRAEEMLNTKKIPPFVPRAEEAGKYRRSTGLRRCQNPEAEPAAAQSHTV